jgi:hypothetical protein
MKGLSCLYYLGNLGIGRGEKMKKSTLYVIAALAICSLLGLVFVSCEQSTGPDFGGAEFAGIWVYDIGLMVETLTITTNTFEVKDTGVIAGTMQCSITSYDETANHIKMTVTSVSGDYVGVVPIGTVWYVTYSISGNEMLVAQDTSGYPASATDGPYIKQ